MSNKRYVIMGAGEVGCHLARTLSVQGHRVTVIDSDASKRQIVEEQFDAAFVHGNGANLPTLEAARVKDCELFVAVSSSDEANLATSLLAKHLGAPRTVVRVALSGLPSQWRLIQASARVQPPPSMRAGARSAPRGSVQSCS